MEFNWKPNTITRRGTLYLTKTSYHRICPQRSHSIPQWCCIIELVLKGPCISFHPNNKKYSEKTTTPQHLRFRLPPKPQKSIKIMCTHMPGHHPMDMNHMKELMPKIQSHMTMQEQVIQRFLTPLAHDAPSRTKIAMGSPLLKNIISHYFPMSQSRHSFFNL